MKFGVCAIALALAAAYPACGMTAETASFSLTGVPLSTVAAAVHDFTGIQIAVSSNIVDKKIDFYSETPLSSAQAVDMLRQIARSNGIRFMTDGIRFVSEKGQPPAVAQISLRSTEADPPAEKLAGESRAKQAPESDLLSFRLQYAVAGEVESLVERLLHNASGKAAMRPTVVGVDVRGNTIYVRANDVDGSRLAHRVIAQIDRPSESPADTSVLYLRHADALRVTAALRALSPRSAQAGTPLSTIQASGGNTLLLSAPAPLRRNLITIAEALDVPTARVGVEIHVADLAGGGVGKAGSRAPLLASASVSTEDGEEARLDLSLLPSQNEQCSLRPDRGTSRLRVALRPRVIDGGRVRMAVRLEMEPAKGEFPSPGADILETSVVVANAEEVTVAGMSPTFGNTPAAPACNASLHPGRLRISLRALLEDTPEREIPQPAIEAQPMSVQNSVEEAAPGRANGNQDRPPKAEPRDSTLVGDSPLPLILSAALGR